jgi:cytochrome d ubiquinol oxidase subunit I
MRPNPVRLSRGQFAWVLAWHILLPTFTIVLASFVTVPERMFLTLILTIFSISLGMGIVTAITMPFQSVTNRSRFADATVISPLLAYKGLTVFLLKAAFWSLLLFGPRPVPYWASLAAVMMVT